MVDRWPEGPAADPEAARERYDSDMRTSRKALRDCSFAACEVWTLGAGPIEWH
ncbi:hypothetical protein ACFWA5_15290 [Streptomyces mirabilis]|uniref:hypothetical protein n=1 Tax=Streptomyces mirabilis TaxID=68239 RepID=UPI00366309DE